MEDSKELNNDSIAQQNQEENKASLVKDMLINAEEKETIVEYSLEQRIIELTQLLNASDARCNGYFIIIP